jgi:regulator of sigma E protease
MLFATYGQRYTPPDISEVVAGSPAASAGLQPGDKILKIGGMAIERFEDMQAIVQQSPNQPLDLTIERAGATLSLSVTPALVDLDDGFGGTHKIGQLGISRANIAYRHVDPTRALGLAAKETFLMAYGTLEAIGQMIVGKRSTDDLGGPIRIGHMSGQVAQEGFVSLIYLMALLSINLGLINLFPVPMLDGGHLVFYLWEAVFRRPLRPRIQEIGLKVGFVLVIALMVWVTSKDLIRLDRMFDLF